MSDEDGSLEDEEGQEDYSTPRKEDRSGLDHIMRELQEDKGD